MKAVNLLVLALSLTFASAYAQSMGEERVLNSAPINVDGYLSEDKPVTDGELESIRSELNKQKMGTALNKEKAKDLGKLTNQTEKLLDSQDEYIDQKIESTQAIKEFNSQYEENQKKLRCIMEESNSAECEPYKNKYRRERQEKAEVEEVKEEVQEVKVAQAAPVVSTAEIAPALGPSAPFEEIKFLPYVGATSYKGEAEDLESKYSAGARLESNINSRFSMGVGFSYTAMSTTDFGNGQNYMNSGYYNNFGQNGREIDFNAMGFDIYGKFFITNNERFRPYVGAGLGYSRAKMKYKDNDSYNDYGGGYYNNYQTSQYGSEEYSTSFATGQLMLGSEIKINHNIGFNIEAQYATALSDSFSSKSSKNAVTSPDQKRLNDLGKDILSANMLSIFAGVVVNF
jgi:outer membrane protein W